jgi:hypothetical protein
MQTNLINSLQNSRRAPAFREPIHHIANGHRDAEGLQRLLRGGYLGRELRGGEDVVEERLGAHLDEARDEFGFGVRFEVREERVAALLPFIAAVEAELVGNINNE